MESDYNYSPASDLSIIPMLCSVCLARSFGLASYCCSEQMNFRKCHQILTYERIMASRKSQHGGDLQYLHEAFQSTLR